MSRKLTIAVAQYDVPQVDKAALDKLQSMAVKAADKGASLLVGPETAIGAPEDAKRAAKTYVPALQTIAKQNRLAIAISLYVDENGQCFNQGYIIGRTGEIVHKQRKIYLAAPEQALGTISAGDEIHVSDSDIGKFGMLVCKDGFNRYSHFLYDKLNMLGAEIIGIPSWSIGWKEHNTQEYIKALFTYGAFASRAYVLVAGNLNAESRSFGRSLIVSPIRGVLQEGSADTEELLVAAIDLDEVKQARDFDAHWQPHTKLL